VNRASGSRTAATGSLVARARSRAWFTAALAGPPLRRTRARRHRAAVPAHLSRRPRSDVLGSSSGPGPARMPGLDLTPVEPSE
jgi:hypothetical protein